MRMEYVKRCGMREIVTSLKVIATVDDAGSRVGGDAPVGRLR
jgi:hypothetical protein